MASILSPPAIIVFLDQDYCYRSVATQIPHDFGLALVNPAVGQTQDPCIQGRDSGSAPR